MQNDPCSTRLREVLIPACKSIASCDGGAFETCCNALTNPESDGCSPLWREGYITQSNFYRRKLFRTCPARRCDTRAPCEWTVQREDSPCVARECAAYYQTTVMNPRCEEYVHDYCVKHMSEHPGTFVDSLACDVFLARLAERTRGASVDASGGAGGMRLLDLDAECSATLDYLQTNPFFPTQISSLCYDQIRERCATDRNCTCLVPEFSSNALNATLMVPCPFNHCVMLPLSWDVSERIQAYVGVIVLIVFSIVSITVRYVRVDAKRRAKGEATTAKNA